MQLIVGEIMNFNNTKAIFLDRDGTINKEVEYLYKPSDFEFIPGVKEALKVFHELGYLVIVITNQSGVARGYYKEDDILKLHNFINEQLMIQSIKINEKNDSKMEQVYNKAYLIDAFYYCPHHPHGYLEKYAHECQCRKPNTGMIKNALLDFKMRGINIELSESFIVGDKETDIETGKNICIKKTVLVRSGHQIDENNTNADLIFNNLFDFSQYLLNSSNNNAKHNQENQKSF